MDVERHFWQDFYRDHRATAWFAGCALLMAVTMAGAYIVGAPEGGEAIEVVDVLAMALVGALLGAAMAVLPVLVGDEAD